MLSGTMPQLNSVTYVSTASNMQHHFQHSFPVASAGAGQEDDSAVQAGT
jgi:hypothetical protein